MKFKHCLVLTVSMVFSALSIAYAGDIQVTVNEKSILFQDAKPLIDENNRTLVPIGTAADAMGLEVLWDSVEKRASFVKTYIVTEASVSTPVQSDNGEEVQMYLVGTEVTFDIGKNNCTVIHSYTGAADADTMASDTEEIRMDTTAITKEGAAYVPIRYLAEVFGLSLIHIYIIIKCVIIKIQ